MAPNAWYPHHLNQEQFGSWIGPLGSFGDPGAISTGLYGSGVTADYPSSVGV